MYKTLAVLFFGRQRFRIYCIPTWNCVRIDIEGINPLAVFDRITELIDLTINECMRNLHYSARFLHVNGNAENSGIVAGSPAKWVKRSYENLPTNTQLTFLSLNEVQRCVKEHTDLFDDYGSCVLNESELTQCYGSWVRVYHPLESYDVFLSYRWNDFDSPLTLGLFDRFSLFNITSLQRAVEVFLDRMRLQDGRNFRDDFGKSLAYSTVVVPIISYEALLRMMKHDPTTVDNVLVEWILALCCEAEMINRENKRIFPVMMGKMDMNIGRRKRLDFREFDQLPSKLNVLLYWSDLLIDVFNHRL